MTHIDRTLAKSLLLLAAATCALVCGADFGAPAEQSGAHTARPPAGSSTLQASMANSNSSSEHRSMKYDQLERQYYVSRRSLGGSGAQSAKPAAASMSQPAAVKCARQSVVLARQMLAHELTRINQFNSIWFNDLDKDELLEGQKHSLSGIVMSGASTSLLNSNGQPLIEIESSYFRAAGQPHQPHQPITIKLMRRHADRCYLSAERRQFTYVLGLSIGPLEHHLDLVYNLPKDIGLSQPLSWRYAQISMLVPKMSYEISLRQVAPGAGGGGGNFILTSGCPLEIADVTYLQNSAPAPAIQSYGLAVNNQTLLQIERLFDDYTRPSVSARLRQLLKFYLNAKTLPLAAGVTDEHHHL